MNISHSHIHMPPPGTTENALSSSRTGAIPLQEPPDQPDDLRLCYKLDNTTRSLDFLFCLLADESGFDDEWFVETSFTEQFVETQVTQIDDRYGSFRRVNFGFWESDEFVDVDGGTEVVVLELVVMPHTDFTKVTRMVLIEIGPVVVLTTGQTSTTRMLSVLSYTTVTGRYMTTVFPGV